MSNWSINGITSITVTGGEQRKSKRAGLSYDFMDKLNSLVDNGVFIDKDNNGFTNKEKLALEKAFHDIHRNRNDIKSFTSIQAGEIFDYNDSEFLRLAEAAGYILKQEENSKENVLAKEELPEITSENRYDDEISRLNNKLSALTSGMSKEEKLEFMKELRQNKISLKNDILDLEKDYTRETTTKHRLLGKDKTETVETPKSEDQFAKDIELAKSKREEYDEIAKMEIVENLYSFQYPPKYAPQDGDKRVNRIITTEDNQKLAKVLEEKIVNGKDGNNRTVLVEKYYPISLRDFNENKENSFPQYYYRVDEHANPINYKQ